MSHRQIDINHLYHTAEVALDIVDDVIMRRGLNYYQHGKVESLYLRDSMIEAVVLGTEPYHVSLDLQHFTNSSCNCPYNVICKHIVATLCEVLSAITDPEDFFIGTRKGIPRQNDQTVQETDSSDHWTEAFELAFSSYVSGYTYDLPFKYQKFFDDWGHRAEHWHPSHRFVYHLYLALFSLQKLEAIEKRTAYTSDRQLKATFQFVLTHLLELLKEENHPPFHQLKEWAALLTYQALSSTPSTVDWLTIYRLVCWHALRNTDWIAEEKLKLEELLHHPSLPLLQRRTLRLMLAHLEFMLDQDDSARALLTPIMSASEVSEAIFYLSVTSHLEQWNRLSAWLHWLYPYLAQTEQNDLRLILGFWARLADAQPAKRETWIEVLTSLLPASSSFYLDHLLETEQFRRWVDFLLVQGYVPSHISKDLLKRVESSDLPALLPFYHRAVELSIREKNRQAYKQAVKLLKKLRTYYKRLKQVDRWNAFILQLADKHKRLRALQEELQKGKLLP
ncbi:SWIM zinc finger domain-containing protein [Ammoniphilus sp. 3BR4]|uniref:SWIM zinc finger family protein n=1 Tax=Ammoniphilus sp. 3BR4 TaxID=3158265 RepID=UPI0034666C54